MGLEAEAEAEAEEDAAGCGERRSACSCKASCSRCRERASSSSRVAMLAARASASRDSSSVVSQRLRRRASSKAGSVSGVFDDVGERGCSLMVVWREAGSSKCRSRNRRRSASSSLFIELILSEDAWQAAYCAPLFRGCVLKSKVCKSAERLMRGKEAERSQQPFAGAESRRKGHTKRHLDAPRI